MDAIDAIVAKQLKVLICQCLIWKTHCFFAVCGIKYPIGGNGFWIPPFPIMVALGKLLSLKRWDFKAWNQ